MPRTLTISETNSQEQEAFKEQYLRYLTHYNQGRISINCFEDLRRKLITTSSLSCNSLEQIEEDLISNFSLVVEPEVTPHESEELIVNQLTTKLSQSQEVRTQQILKIQELEEKLFRSEFQVSQFKEEITSLTFTKQRLQAVILGVFLGNLFYWLFKFLKKEK